jgi:uncharacterized protein
LPYLKLIPAHNFKNISLSEKYRLSEDIDNYDYIYSMEKLALMKGKQYESIRRFVNKFQRLYSWEVKYLDLDDKNTWEEIAALNRIWVSQKQPGNSEIQDLSTVQRFRSIYENINYFALGIYIEGTIRGYCIIELNSMEFTNCLFIYADTDYHGIYPFMKKQFASRLLDMGYNYLNFQQDSGFKGLRRYKRSLRPEFYLKKFIITDSGISITDKWAKK